MLWLEDLNSILSDKGKLHNINRGTHSLVNYSEASSEDVLALLQTQVRIPFVGNQGKSEMLCEPCYCVILGNVSAMEVHSGEMRFAILKTSHNKGVVVWVLVVSLFVGNFLEVVGIFLDAVADFIIEEFSLPGEFCQSSGGLLEI